MDDTIFDAVESLKFLSGVGEKSAQRYVNDILDMDEMQLQNFLNKINSLQNIKRCSVCNNYTTEEKCNICREERDTNSLIIVATPAEINIIDKLFEKKYDFHVLGGVIDPLKGKSVDDLSFTKLAARISNYDELITALPTTTQGELTSNYIFDSFKSNIAISKLAQGIPLGGSVEYLDELTLYKAINARQNYEE